MDIVITMAGLGSRFRQMGYNCPKYMIEVKGKTLFEWSMDSLLDYNDHVDKYCFVVRKEDNAGHFINNRCGSYGIKNVSVIEIDQLTDGQATTALIGISNCEKKHPIMIYNIDTYIEPYSMKYDDIAGSGYIPCFVADGTHWSFVRIDELGRVVEVREKERISDYCTVGAYYFSSADLYQSIYGEFYRLGNDDTKGERYIAPMYNYMIKNGYEITMSVIPSEKVHVLGTPDELEVFAKQ